MGWKSDEEYKRKLSSSRTASLREESLRQVRTNIAQILDGLYEIQPKIKEKTINKDYLSEFEEWFWKRNQKAKSADSEKIIAYMNRIRRYFRIAVQMSIPSDQIHRDFDELVTFFSTLLQLYSDPEEVVDDDLSYLERIEVLEKSIFPRLGMEPGKGPDSSLIYLSSIGELFSCLKVLLTPTIPPIIPKKVERRLFGISEKITNIFSGITLNFVTDPKFFDVTFHGEEGDELWQIPGISYQKVMQPFLSDFGVSEQAFFKALCSYIGLQIAESKSEGEEFFILDPSFVKVFNKIGYLQKHETPEKKIIWYPNISEDTLYLQYLALVSTNRSAVQPDFAFWVSLTFAYFLYRLIAEDYLSEDNCLRSFIIDDLVRVSVVPYSVKSIALELGGLDWAKKMPVDLDSRKDVLSGLLKISSCNFNNLKEIYEKVADDFFDEVEEDEEVEVEDILNDSRFWNR